VGVFFYIMFLMFSKSPPINPPKECLLNILFPMLNWLEAMWNNKAPMLNSFASMLNNQAPMLNSFASMFNSWRTMLNNLANLFEVKPSSEPLKQYEQKTSCSYSTDINRTSEIAQSKPKRVKIVSTCFK
jgi:hypothetical protein